MEKITLEELAERVKEEKIKTADDLELINMAKAWEKEGKTDHAAVVYEYLLLNNFEGSYPYDRLVVIYRKQKKKDEIIRVLERAVYIFENIVYEERADRKKKLDKYKKALDKEKGKG